MSPGPLVLMAPGWVRTELGGPDARLSIDDSIPNVVKTLDACGAARVCTTSTTSAGRSPW